MKFLKGEKESGQVLVILTVGIVVLLSFAALAIDSGMYYVDRRQAQNAADSAALAGVLAKYDGEDCVSHATDRAASNGYTDNGADVDVQVDCNYGENGDYVLVTITSTNDTFLANLFGRNELTSQVVAEAHYSSGEGSNSSAFNGGAIMALKPEGNDTFEISGNAALTTEGGGAFVNSNGSKAFTGNGNLTYTTETGIVIVGGARITGNVTLNTDITAGKTVSTSGNIDINGTVLENQSVAAIPYPPAELEIAAPVVDSPSCSGSGTMTTSGGVVRLTPGNHPARSISGNNNVIFEPGNYCFSGNLSIDGNFTVTANNVKFNMGSKSISLAGNMTFNAANSLFYLDSGTFTMDGNAQVNIPNSTVYMISGDFKLNGNNNPRIISDQTSIVYLGSGDLHFNGNSTFNSTNTVFYLNGGSMTWNGNTKLVMDPPDDGDYAGLLIYMPSSNSSTLKINGNSGAALTGSIIAPGAAIEIIGNSGTTTYHSRIIGYTIDISGNSNTTVNFIEDENYPIDLGESPYIELTK